MDGPGISRGAPHHWKLAIRHTPCFHQKWGYTRLAQAQSRRRIIFRAGLSRFALGLTTIFLLEFFYPLGRPHVWIYVAYLIFAAVEQGLIWYEIGGERRTFVAGLVDFLVLTLAIHWMGSIMAMMATVYVLAAVINVVAVGPRVGSSCRSSARWPIRWTSGWSGRGCCPSLRTCRSSPRWGRRRSGR